MATTDYSCTKFCLLVWYKWLIFRAEALLGILVDQLLYCNGDPHTSRRENCPSPLYLCLRYLTNPDNKNKLFCCMDWIHISWQYILYVFWKVQIPSIHRSTETAGSKICSTHLLQFTLVINKFLQTSFCFRNWLRVI